MSFYFFSAERVGFTMGMRGGKSKSSKISFTFFSAEWVGFAMGMPGGES